MTEKKKGVKMSKLCLGTLLTVIKKCAVKKGFVQKTVFYKMFSTMHYEYDPDESLIGHIVRGAKNPSPELIDKINEMNPSEYCQISDCMDDIVNRIDAQKIDLLGKLIKKIADEDEDIAEDTVVDLINGTKKKDLPGEYSSLSSFLAGVFIFVIKNTDNSKKTEYVKEINDHYIAQILADDKIRRATLPQNDREEELNENDIIRAKQFLIDHEKERELIPLCQIAYVLNPNHKHIRPMITEYNLLPYNTRKYILEQCDAEGLIDVDNFHVEKSIKLLCDDLEKHGLSSKRYLYVFTQYFPRNFINYANCSVEQYDLCSFERLCKPDALKSIVGDCSTLDEYIDDYLWLRENGIQTEALPPMDYLWNQKDLGACREEILVFWLYRFIVDVCNNLFYRINKKEFWHIDIDDQCAERQEDLYYIAINALYNHYQCHLNREGDNGED